MIKEEILEIYQQQYDQKVHILSKTARKKRVLVVLIILFFVVLVYENFSSIKSFCGFGEDIEAETAIVVRPRSNSIRAAYVKNLKEPLKLLTDGAKGIVKSSGYQCQEALDSLIADLDEAEAKIKAEAEAKAKAEAEAKAKAEAEAKAKAEAEAKAKAEAKPMAEAGPNAKSESDGKKSDVASAQNTVEAVKTPAVSNEKTGAASIQTKTDKTSVNSGKSEIASKEVKQVKKVDPMAKFKPKAEVLINDIYQFASMPLFEMNPKAKALKKDVEKSAKLMGITLNTYLKIEPLEFKKAVPSSQVGVRNLFSYGEE